MEIKEGNDDDYFFINIHLKVFLILNYIWFILIV